MRKHTFYRVINFIILPISAFIGLQVIMSILVALTNPALLLGLFVIACVPLYAFTANYFYNKGIRKGEPCKPSLKDWIKANAIVSIIFAALVIFSCLGMLALLNNPKMIDELRNQVVASTGKEVSIAEFKRLLKFYCYFFLPFGILLLIHIIITFRLLSRYRFIFLPSPEDPK